MTAQTIVSLSDENAPVTACSYAYSAFGLTISSSIECPELHTVDVDLEPDVTVCTGAVPCELTGATSIGVRHQATSSRLLLRVDRVARFLISDGRSIVIDRDPSATDDDVRVFLLNAVFAVLLHQREVLVLQGSMVRVDDGAVVFLGKSAVGKSTLAAALDLRGYSCLADEVCAIAVHANDGARALPSYPQIALWPDSIRHLGLDAGALPRVRPLLEKRAYRSHRVVNGEPLPIKHIFILSPTRERAGIETHPIVGAKKMDVLLEYGYRGEFIRDLGRRLPHFQQTARLCPQVPLTRLFRPDRPFMLGELASHVEDALRS
jgi:hypothetical protein